jgi:lactoylglutathione lyase
VRYSFVRDPDGNWIELSERASLTGKPVAAG